MPGMFLTACSGYCLTENQITLAKTFLVQTITKMHSVDRIAPSLTKLAFASSDTYNMNENSLTYILQLKSLKF